VPHTTVGPDPSIASTAARARLASSDVAPARPAPSVSRICRLAFSTISVGKSANRALVAKVPSRKGASHVTSQAAFLHANLPPFHPTRRPVRSRILQPSRREHRSRGFPRGIVVQIGTDGPTVCREPGSRSKPPMTPHRQTLLSWIDRDRDFL